MSKLVVNINYDVGISDAVKTKVRSVDPNKGRCLVENCPEIRAVDFCYCVPWRIVNNYNVCNKLEWFWNMKQRSLYLDTHNNLFRAGSAIHHLHDTDSFLLLPEDDMILQYFNSLNAILDSIYFAERASFPDIPDGEFHYRFVPIQRIEPVAITRQNQNYTTDPPSSSDDFTIHVYPFKTLPLLKSHLHPKYAIFEAGRKLEKLPSDKLIRVLSDYACLSWVMKIYSAWTKGIPKEAQQDLSYINLEEEDEDEDGGFGVSNFGDEDDQSSRGGSRRKRKRKVSLSATPPRKMNRKRRVSPSATPPHRIPVSPSYDGCCSDEYEQTSRKRRRAVPLSATPPRRTKRWHRDG